MTHVNIPAAKTIPVAKLLRKDLRGIAKGLFTMSPDFDRPMTEKELEEFLGPRITLDISQPAS
jgi:hypothetical protein